MDIKKLNKTGRISEWAQMVSQCRNSGKTVTAWCEEHGINIKTYYYRQKSVCEAIPDMDRPVKLSYPSSDTEPTFTEVRTIGRYEKRDAAVTVRFGCAEMDIRNGADPKVIEATLRLLSKIC